MPGQQSIRDIASRINALCERASLPGHSLSLDTLSDLAGAAALLIGDRRDADGEWRPANAPLCAFFFGSLAPSAIQAMSRHSRHVPILFVREISRDRMG
jgi:hypothetical protein